MGCVMLARVEDLPKTPGAFQEYVKDLVQGEVGPWSAVRGGRRAALRGLQLLREEGEVAWMRAQPFGGPRFVQGRAAEGPEPERLDPQERRRVRVDVLHVGSSREKLPRRGLADDECSPAEDGPAGLVVVGHLGGDDAPQVLLAELAEGPVDGAQVAGPVASRLSEGEAVVSLVQAEGDGGLDGVDVHQAGGDDLPMQMQWSWQRIREASGLPRCACGMHGVDHGFLTTTGDRWCSFSGQPRPVVLISSLPRAQVCASAVAPGKGEVDDERRRGWVHA